MNFGLLCYFTFVFVGSSSGLTCTQCSSSNNPECATAPSAVNSTCESKLCFHTQHKETKEVTRGCFSGEPTSICKLPECKVCDSSDRCNVDPYNIGRRDWTIFRITFSIPIPECLLCESSQNENCRTEVHLIKTSCESASCFSRINRETGGVQRGCVKDNGCSGDKDCHICRSQRCNTQKLPITTCLHCIGPKCVDPDVNAVDTISCEGGNKCIVKYNDKRQVYRGCTEDPEEKCPVGEACSICDTDKCNSGKFPFQKSATMSCMKCDSSQGQFCSEKELISGVPAKCVGTYPFHEKEACYVDETTTSFKWGCFYELTADEQYFCLTKGNCRTCHSEGCNRYDEFVEYLGYKCFICDNCEKVDGRSSSECSPIPTNKNGGSGCFVKRNEDETVSRNCLSKSTCSGDRCLKCDSDSCNTMDAPGKGSMLIGVEGLIGVLVVLLLKL